MATSVIQAFRNTLDTGEPYYSHDYIHPRADIDGVEAYEWELHRIAMPDGRNAVVCYYYDCTQLRETEQALRRNEAWLRGQKEAFQASVDGAPLEQSLGILVRSAIQRAGGDVRAAFFLVNAEGTAITHVTGMALEYGLALGDFPIGPDSLGCGLAAYIGQPVLYSDIWSDPALISLRPLAQQFNFRAAWSFPVQIADGKIVGTFCMYSQEACEATEHDMEVATAVTHAAAVIIARHQATQERTRAEQALRDADRRKNEFLALLAHELRNPLAAIRNTGQILAWTDGDVGTLRMAAEMLNRQVDHMVRQVDDLLDVNRIIRGKIELRKENTELVRIVNHAVESNRPLCEKLGHQLTVRLPPGPVHVHGDQVRLTQVVGNLLNNACKFTPRGGHIELAIEQDGAQATIRVRDSGIGIDAAELGQVFEMFVQSDKSLERSQDGLGVGLALVRSLVEMHGGVVEARSEGPGRGSEFVVCLPVLPGPQPVEPRVQSSRSTAGVVSRRVLVADDNQDSATSLATLLKLMGHITEVAVDGLEAVDKAATFNADIILMDIGMPNLNGYEAARRIRLAQKNRLMLVALTGMGLDEDRRLSMEAGFDAHLVKPVELDELTKLLAAETTE